MTRIAASTTVLVLLAVLIHAHEGGVDDADGVPCDHDFYQSADRGGFVGRGTDLVVPQAYQEHQDHPQSAHRTYKATVADGYPLRIVVSAVDARSVSSTCQSIGQSVPDFIGGRVTCSDAVDLLSSGKLSSLLDYALPMATARIASVVRLSRMTTAPLSVFQGVCPYFTVPDDQLKYGVASADLALYIGASKTYGQTIAWSSLCGMDQFNRPTFGRMNIGSRYLPSNWYAADPFERERIVRTLTHELVHLLGFTYEFMSTFLPSKLLASVPALRGKSYNVVAWVGANAVQAARIQMNCPTLSFVELEDQGGSGTALSHLERHTYLQELMNGISGARWRGNQFSAITLGILADMGHYVTSPSADGEFMAWGNRAGCPFVQERCIQVLPAGSDEGESRSGADAANTRVLFDPPSSLDSFFCSPNGSSAVNAAASFAEAHNFSTGSSVTSQQWIDIMWATATPDSMGEEATYDHLAYGSCKLFRGAAALPAAMQYFPGDPRLGGNVSLVDYCPVVVPPLVPTSTGTQETQQCYDGGRSSPGAWMAVDNTTRGAGHYLHDVPFLAFKGPHAGSINVVVIRGANCTSTTASAEGSSSGSANSTRDTGTGACASWGWTQDAMCVEMRCVVNATKVSQLASLSSWVAVTNRSAPVSSEQWSAVTLQWRVFREIENTTSDWLSCDGGGAGVQLGSRSIASIASSVTEEEYVFARCPRVFSVCSGGEQWRDAIWMLPTTTTGPSTTTTLPPTTIARPTTTLLPTTPPPPRLTTTVATTTTTTTVPATTLAPSTDTPVEAEQNVTTLTYQFRWSGGSWAAVLNDRAARANISTTLRGLAAKHWNVPEADVNVTNLRVGSLIADIELEWPASLNGSTAPPSASSMTNVAALAEVYAHTSGASGNDVALLSAMPVTTAPAPPPSPPSSSDVAGFQYCSTQGWCLGLVIGGVLGVAALCGIYALRRLRICADQGDTSSTEASNESSVVVSTQEGPTADSLPASPLRRSKLTSFHLPPQMDDTPQRVAIKALGSLSTAGSTTPRIGRQMSILSSTGGASSFDGAGSPVETCRGPLPSSPRGAGGGLAAQSDSDMSTVDLRQSPRRAVSTVGLATSAWDALGTPSVTPTATPTTGGQQRVESFDAYSAASSPRATSEPATHVLVPPSAPHNVLAPQPRQGATQQATNRLTSVPMVGRRRRYWSDV